MAVVQCFDHESLHQVQNCKSQVKIGHLYNKVDVLWQESCDGVIGCE